MTKLVLKCGDIEVEYEGPEEFLKAELPELIKVVAELRNVKKAPTGGGEQKQEQTSETQSVSTIAQKLAVGSGPDLIMASTLSLAQNGSPTFTKKEIRSTMKKATAFYKASYRTNTDRDIAGLVKKGRLNHLGGDTYPLPAPEKTALERNLAGTVSG